MTAGCLSASAFQLAPGHRFLKTRCAGSASGQCPRPLAACAALPSGRRGVAERSLPVQQPQEQLVLQRLHQAKPCWLGKCCSLLLGLVLVC